MEVDANRKVRVGQVVSNKMQKTVTVKVERTFRHPIFHKVVTKAKKYYAHTDLQLEIGQTVEIMETRPLSKLKRWRVIKAV